MESLRSESLVVPLRTNDTSAGITSNVPVPDTEAGTPASYPVTQRDHRRRVVLGWLLDTAAARAADPWYLNFRIKYLRVRLITHIQ